MLLGDLEDALIESGAPVAAALRPGLSEQQLDDVKKRFGYGLPEEIRELYGWHDGALHGTGPAPTLLGPWTFPPLESELTWSATKWQAWKAEVYPDWDDHDGPWEGFLPVFRTRDDQNAIVVQCIEQTPLAGRLATWELWDPVPPAEGLRQASLSSLLETWLWWLSTNAMVWDVDSRSWERGTSPLHWTTYRMGFC